MLINPRTTLLLLLPLLLGMRDPFVPVEDPCREMSLSQWHYGGSVGAGSRLMAFLRDDTGKWQRVEKDAVLHNRWRIVQVADDALTIASAESCEPQVQRLIREGTQYDKKDKPVGAHGAAVDSRQ